MERQWYSRPTWLLLLSPLSAAFAVTAAARRLLLQSTRQKLAVPVVVVGNISVGGTGKTPLLIALVKHLQHQGWTPGVISRGYGGQAAQYPLVLNEKTRVDESGDEPLSIFQQTGCAVCVDADRVTAARTLEKIGCNILLSDDGLQHYRLGRTLEIVVSAVWVTGFVCRWDLCVNRHRGCNQPILWWLTVLHNLCRYPLKRPMECASFRRRGIRW